MDFKRFFLDVEGITRYFYLAVPESVKSGKAAPLALLLHGAGGNPRTVKNLTGMNPLAEREGFIAVYPQGTGPNDRDLTWNTGHCCGFAYENDIDDVAFIERLIEELILEWPIDEDRIFIAGISNGAMMAHRLGCCLSAKLAAIAVVAGTMPPNCPTPETPLPVIMFHGTADRYVPYNGGMSDPSVVKHPVEHASVRQTVDAWIRFNGCDPTPSSSETSGVVTKEVFKGDTSRQDTVLFTIEGGGHTWPGTSVGEPDPNDPMQQLSATPIIWDFFKHHPRIPQSP